jgi:hypothetical protein
MNKVRGRSKCPHADLCLYGTSEFLPLGRPCEHTEVHRKSGLCGSPSHICWIRYMTHKEIIRSSCRDQRGRTKRHEVLM